MKFRKRFSGKAAFSAALKICLMICREFIEYPPYRLIPAPAAVLPRSHKPRQLDVKISSDGMRDQNRDIHLLKHRQVVFSFADANRNKLSRDVLTENIADNTND